MSARKTTKLAAFALLALLAALPAGAAVTVTSAAGTFATASTFQVVGTNFQTKSPAKPYLWAPFNSSSAADTTLGLNNFNSYHSLSFSAGTGYAGGCLAASDGVGNWTAGVAFSNYTTEGQRWYLYRISKQNFLVTSATQNWKTLRIWPVGINYPNMYCSATNGIFNVEDGTGTGFYASFNTGNTNWNEEEFQFQASSAINLKDGSVMYRDNGVQKASGSLQTRSTARPAYMSNGYLLHAVLANQGSWSPAWSSSNRISYDNVYFDTTWSRVMVGEASTYAACHNLQPQIPTAWSTTNIIVSGNFSGFSNGATVYVYVVDKDGNVNANGLAVAVAGSAGSPAPTISAIAYSTGSYVGASGNFANGTGFSGSVGVLVGTVPATGVSLVSGTKINFTVPGGAPNTVVDVTVTNGDGQSATLSSAFTYGGIPAPTLTSIDYSTGSYTGGTGNTARGTNYFNPVSVKVGTTTATGISLLSSSAIAFTVPPGPPGTIQSVQVINGDGQTVTRSNAFTYSSPGGGGGAQLAFPLWK